MQNKYFVNGWIPNNNFSMEMEDPTNQTAIPYCIEKLKLWVH